MPLALSLPGRGPLLQRCCLLARRFSRNSLGVPRVARYSFDWDVKAGVFAGLYMGMTFPFFTKIARDELGASGSAIALMAAAPFIGNLFSPLWARQMEGKDKLPFCVGSWALGRLLLILMPLAATGNIFVAFIVGLQLIATVSTPAYTSLMRDIYPDHTRGRMMGYVRVVVQAMAFLATLVTGRLLDAHISFRYLFPIAGLFGILAGWAFYKVRLLPHVARQEPLPPSSGGALTFIRETLAILKHNLPYRYFALSVFIYGFANLMVQPLYQLYQVDVLHITSTQIANLANLASLVAIGGSFFWGRFMDRYGPPTTVMVSISLIAVIPMVYLFAKSVPFLFFAAALAGFGFSGVELSYLSSILLYAEPGRTAQYQSLHSLLLGVRGVLASLVSVPLAHRFGYTNIFAVALLIMLIGSGLQYLAIRAAKERSATRNV